MGYYGESKWRAIAKRVGTRNHVQCLQRWKKVLKPGLIKGQWSLEEDQKLVALVKKGFKNWGQLAMHMEGRTSKQCRERWCHHLDPKINKSNFSAEEDRMILRLQAEKGNKWADISQSLPGRTENAVKSRWKALMRNTNNSGSEDTNANGNKGEDIGGNVNMTFLNVITANLGDSTNDTTDSISAYKNNTENDDNNSNDTNKGGKERGASPSNMSISQISSKLKSEKAPTSATNSTSPHAQPQRKGTDRAYHDVGSQSLHAIINRGQMIQDDLKLEETANYDNNDRNDNTDVKQKIDDQKKSISPTSTKYQIKSKSEHESSYSCPAGDLRKRMADKIEDNRQEPLTSITTSSSIQEAASTSLSPSYSNSNFPRKKRKMALDGDSTMEEESQNQSQTQKDKGEEDHQFLTANLSLEIHDGEETNRIHLREVDYSSSFSSPPSTTIPSPGDGANNISNILPSATSTTSLLGEPGFHMTSSVLSLSSIPSLHIIGTSSTSKNSNASLEDPFSPT